MHSKKIAVSDVTLLILLHRNVCGHCSSTMVAVGRSLLLFAALAALLTVQAATDATAKFSPLFVNWLSQQTSTKIRTAGYYEEVETESVCLQEVAYRNCRCFHTEEVFNQTVCPHDYIE